MAAPAQPKKFPWQEKILVPKDICRPLDWGDIFPSQQPVHLDLGAGDGGFAASFAEADKNINLLAVERLLGRVRKIARRAGRAGLDNLRVLRFESSYAVRYLVPEKSVSAIHVMHPDPWPKRKQKKHRLFQPEFVAACARALISGGELRLTLDHAEYFDAIRCLVDASSEFVPFEWEPNSDYPLSDFQRQFLSEGQPIYRRRWRRV